VSADDLPRATAGEADRAIFRPSKLKGSALTAGGALFAAGGVLMIVEGEPWGWLVTAVCALMTLVGIAFLIPGAMHLAIDRDGFEMKGVFHAQRYRWEDVDAFFPILIGETRHVGFNFAPTYDRMQRRRRSARGLSGAEGCLPDTYGLGVEPLTELMNERLARAQGERPA